MGLGGHPSPQMTSTQRHFNKGSMQSPSGRHMSPIHASTSKVTLLAHKLEKLQAYNKEARRIQLVQRANYQREIKEQFGSIYDKDVKSMRGVPNHLCSRHIQNKFLDAKRNMISRRI